MNGNNWLDFGSDYSKTILKYILIIFFSLNLVCSYAQKAKEFEKNYINAKETFQAENYEVAIVQFSNLLVETDQNSQLNHARYFYSYCSYKLQKYSQANQQLLKITYSNCDWKLKEEAYYLLSVISFETEDYKRAIEYSKKCVSNRIINDITNVKKYYLSEIQQLHLLNLLSQDFPNDKELHEIYLLKLLYKQNISRDDENKIQKIIVLFPEFESLLPEKQTNIYSKQKRSYHVALLFPFQLNDASIYSSQRKQQFIIDYYQGLLLAVDTINKLNNEKIILHTFDTERSEDAILKILNQDIIKKMDLIIGPVYPEFNSLITQFSAKNKITSINPLSINNQYIKDSNTYHFSYRTSHEQIGISTAQFLLDSIENKTCVAIFEENSKDTLAFNAFKKHFELNGGKVESVIPIKKKQNILEKLLPIKNTKNLGSVVCFSNQQFAATNVNSFYLIHSISQPLITTAEWLEINEFSIENFKDKEVYFYDYEYINYTKDSVTNFKNNYLKKYNVIPSKYAYYGYETISLLDSIIKENGFFFIEQPQFESINGIYYPFFEFSDDKKCNAFLPIFKMVNYELVPINF